MSEIVRTYETGIDQKSSTFQRPESVSPSKGEALFEIDGQLVPFSKGANFAGFSEGTYSDGKICSTVRGAVVLRISGATDADRGKTVYASGENSFSLKKPGVEIGKIRHVENERAAIAFKRPEVERPLNLVV